MLHWKAHTYMYLPTLLLYHVTKCMLSMVLFVCIETLFVHHIATIVSDHKLLYDGNYLAIWLTTVAS